MSIKFPGPLLVLDVETTGCDPEVYDICQIGAAVVSPYLELEETFESLVHPVSSMRDPEAMKTHGISEQELVDAPHLRVVLDFIDRRIFKNPGITLAGWGVAFDEAFLKAAYKKAGMEYPLSYKKFDTKSAVLFQAWLKNIPAGWHGLARAMDAFGMAFEGKPHSALADVINQVRILRRISGLP